MPSDLEQLSWNVSLADINFKLTTRLALEQLRAVQTFQAVAEVASAVFGGKKTTSAVPQAEEDCIPKTAAEAQALFARVMNGG